MISLLKNHQHYGKVFFMEQIDVQNNKKYFIKSSSSLHGIIDISRELRGIDWYNSKVKCKINYEICIHRKNYMKIKFMEIKGVIPKLSKMTYQSNLSYIEKVIDHYCEVWKSEVINEKVPLHGDFSLLGNIVFINDETPVVIDWEHFESNVSPIGFDAMYFLFELIWFEASQTNNISDENLSHLNKMLLNLKSANCLNEIFINRPLEATRRFMSSNYKYWGSQFNKIPIMFFTKDQVDFIDNKMFL